MFGLCSEALSERHFVSIGGWSVVVRWGEDFQLQMQVSVSLPRDQPCVGGSLRLRVPLQFVCSLLGRTMQQHYEAHVLLTKHFSRPGSLAPGPVKGFLSLGNLLCLNVSPREWKSWFNW